MLTRIRVRAALRAEARQRVFEQACFIIEALQSIMNQPSAYQLPVATLLQNMEQRMQDLVEEMGEICFDEQHDAYIAAAIWGETGEWSED
ncbi:unnamed protein product [Penicillium camemberti]|uniref:Str. FM013 n=1 Tax=Penicillium camemberti (strain FM 013) TaxID=1429867 RepID=A0A0G4P333_PENC3|nr:unnamed protein product [Penicillium camemberti]